VVFVGVVVVVVEVVWSVSVVRFDWCTGHM